jgi:prepilin-type processing-associated H-X9-DG protein
VLPYIEQEALYRRYRFDVNWDNAANGGPGMAIRQDVPIFLCPSAPSQGERETVMNNGRACIDYAATTERNANNPWWSNDIRPFVENADPYYIGVLGHNKVTNGAPDPCRRTIPTIQDGTSNTMLVAECAGRNFLYRQGVQSGTVSRGPWAHPDGRIQVGGYNPAAPTDPVGPCAVNCVNDKEVYAFHAGGANVVMADGVGPEPQGQHPARRRADAPDAGAGRPDPERRPVLSRSPPRRPRAVQYGLPAAADLFGPGRPGAVSSNGTDSTGRRPSAEAVARTRRMADASSVPPPSPEHRRIAAERFEHARRAATSGNHDYAVQLLLTCCKLDPANLIYRQELRRTQKAKHHNNLRGGLFAFLTTAQPKARAKAAKRSRDYLKVLEHGEQVLTRNPWDLGAQMDMAEAADALGLLDVAIFLLEQARQTEGKNPTVNRALARLFEKRGDFGRAIKLWEYVRQAVPGDAEAQHKAKDLAASETIQRGQYEENVEAGTGLHVVQQARAAAASDRAARELHAAQARIDADPTQPGGYLQLAMMYRRAGLTDQALETLHRGLGATGNDFGLQIEIAEMELEPFRKNLALAEEKIKAGGEDDELRKVRVRLLKEINARELELLRLKADRQPGDFNLKLDLGVRLLRAGQTEEAIAELQQARKDAKLVGKAAMYLGFCFKGRNNWRLAQRNFEEALKALPPAEDASRKEVLFQLAQGSAEAGDLAQAVDLGHELANMDFGYRDIGRLLDEWQAKLQKA